MRDERRKQSLRNPAGRDESRMGECAWDEPGRMGRILTGCERRGDSTWKKSCEGRQGSCCFTLKSSLPLPGSHILLTFTISAVCSVVSLLCVSTIAEGPLMCFWTDGIKSALPFPSLPLVCVSAVQWNWENST